MVSSNRRTRSVRRSTRSFETITSKTRCSILETIDRALLELWFRRSHQATMTSSSCSLRPSKFGSPHRHSIREKRPRRSSSSDAPLMNVFARSPICRAKSRCRSGSGGAPRVARCQYVSPAVSFIRSSRRLSSPTSDVVRYWILTTLPRFRSWRSNNASIVCAILGVLRVIGSPVALTWRAFNRSSTATE